MKALRRRYGRSARQYHPFKVGDSVRMVAPWLENESVMGVVREVTPRRVYVWTGQTGFGQRRWPFDEKGNPVGSTRDFRPELRLDMTWEDPFR